MPQITASARNEPQVKQAITKFGAEVALEADKASEATIDGAMDVLKVYPPQRRGSHYKRTGKLGRSYKKTKMKTGWRLMNNADHKGHYYAVYVIGDAEGNRQAKIHQGRWKRARDVIDREFKKQCAQLALTIKKIAAKYSSQGFPGGIS